jgi:hypothetical protein
LTEGGVHLKIIQNRAGHTFPAFIMATHGNLLPGMDQAAAEAYAQAMFA